MGPSWLGISSHVERVICTFLLVKRWRWLPSFREWHGGLHWVISAEEGLEASGLEACGLAGSQLDRVFQPKLHFLDYYISSSLTIANLFVLCLFPDLLFLGVLRMIRFRHSYYPILGEIN
jgi:hypothetical protein